MGTGRYFMQVAFKQIGLILVVALLLIACKPSDKYAGEWYSITNEGEEVMVHFSKDKILTMIDENDQKEQAEFNQSSTGFINEVSYFGIEIKGEKHFVVFENKKDEANAILIKQTNHANDFEDVVGDIVLKMNRDSFPES